MNRIRMALRAAPLRPVSIAGWLAALTLAVWWLQQDIATANVYRIVIDSLFTGWAAFALWRAVQGYRRDPLTLRTALLAEARKVRRHELWLCRDDHVLFEARRFLGLHLRVMNEDDFRDLDTTGRAPVVYSTLVVPVFDTDVLRVVDGATYRIGPDDSVISETDRSGFFRGWADSCRLVWGHVRDRRLSATPDEIRAVIDQLQRAELLGNMKDAPGA